MRKAKLISDQAITAPAIIGPTNRAVLKITEFKATAAGISVLSTSIGTNANLAGNPILAVIPSPADKTNNQPTPIVCQYTSKNKTTASAAERLWVNSRILRRSYRSAHTPANGPITSDGNKSAKAIAPSQKPLCVNSQVSQPNATR